VPFPVLIRIGSSFGCIKMLSYFYYIFLKNFNLFLFLILLELGMFFVTIFLFMSFTACRDICVCFVCLNFSLNH